MREFALMITKRGQGIAGTPCAAYLWTDVNPSEGPIMRPFLFTMTLGLTSALAITSASASSLIDRYYAALHMDEVFEILRSEGVEAGQGMTEDGQIGASPAWTARLGQIYAIDKMDALFRHALENNTAFEGSEEAIAFFETDLGSKIARLELDARVALAVEGMEDQIRERVSEMRGEDPDRIAMYQTFIDVNDLVESNVSGALNANLSFYQGMASNPAFGDGMTEDFMLTTVWAQEGEIREDMKDWTMNFSTLAYSVLSNEDVQQYIDISTVPSGQKLNAVLFAGFDKVFEVQSYELGRATAEFSAGDDT